jgi:SAM-dependent methyltransferase
LVTQKLNDPMTADFADHFSASAAAYARYRPRYPADLFDWLAALAPRGSVAWDCGTGNGQAATALADRMRQVVATDPSEAQLREAERHVRVHYSAMTAERAALAGGSVGLVTVAQAVHWFDLPRFYAEVRRVLVPGGVVALWSYALGTFGHPELDAAIACFYGVTVGPFWPAERALVEAGYGSLDFPFEEIAPPPAAMTASWSLSHLAGYLSSWSAVRRAAAATGRDPVSDLLGQLEPLWGDPDAQRLIRWPLSMRVGRVG